MFFVLSTGRAGSRTISNLLSQTTDALCLHEPVPYLVEETAAYRYGDLDLNSLVTQMRETRPLQMTGRTYGESNNRLALAVPALAEAFPNSRFVWLTRDGRNVVASGHQRGWYDPSRIRDTRWERNRLRADRLGEMSTAEWEALPPFDRVCWLWTRTNEIIRDDLSALDSDRWQLLRLEDLNSQRLDALAEFLEISAPADWAIPRLNARTTTRMAADTAANIVDRVIDPTEWDDYQREAFASWCGGLMDEIYEGWQAGQIYSAHDAEGDPVLAEINQRLADLAVVQGQLDRAVNSEARAHRQVRELQQAASAHKTQLRAETSRADQATALAAAETAAGEKAAATVRALRADLAEAQSGSKQAQAAAKETEAKLKQSQAAAKETEAKLKQSLDATKKARADTKRVKASTSYRLGHRIVLLVKAPLLAARALRRGTRLLIGRARSFGRAKARTLIVQASKSPRARRMAKHLPEATRRRAVALSSGSNTPTKSSDKRGPKNAPKSLERHSPKGRQWTATRFGLNAVVGTGVDPAWQAVIDTVDVTAEPPTHLDLCVTQDGSVPAGRTALVEDLRTTVVAVADTLAPLRPGLNPLGFHRNHNQKFLAIRTGAQPVPSIAATPGRVVEVVDYKDLPNPASRPDAFRERVQSYLGLLDISALHDGDYARARTLVDVAACGVPVSCPDAPALVPILPHSVAESFAATNPRALTCEIEREQWSRLQRRTVLAAAAPRPVLDRLLREAGRPGIRQPSVTVTIASNRPAMIPIWAGQLAEQNFPNFEVVAALHGDAFTSADLDHARYLLGDRLTVCRVPGHHSLGEALNTAATAAGGELLIKWDDDDLYDFDHITDLVQAREYSGATLVGKAAEFAYLAGLDITVRRLKNSTEGFSPTICGATLSIARSDLWELGGWRRSRRRVDSLLIEDVREAGGSTYRTSGFGFIMLRAAGDRHRHTWTADDAYFLRGAIDQRRSLDTAFAGVRGPVSVHRRWGRLS